MMVRMAHKKAARRYHHGDLRRTLLDAALAIVEAGGLGALSLRELAREAGVSHAAPYRHFVSREALVLALAIEGFAGLAAEMDLGAAGERAPLDRMRALGLAYIHHAVAHPGHFRVMFSSELHAGGEEPELLDAGAPSLQALVDAIVEGQLAGAVRSGEPAALALSAWSMVHGLSMLLVDRQLAALVPDGAPVDVLAHAVMDVVVRGLAPDAAAGRARAGKSRRRRS